MHFVTTEGKINVKFNIINLEKIEESDNKLRFQLLSSNAYFYHIFPFYTYAIFILSNMLFLENRILHQNLISLGVIEIVDLCCQQLQLQTYYALHIRKHTLRCNSNSLYSARETLLNRFTFFFCENKISITIPSFLNFQTDANNVSNSHSQQPQQHSITRQDLISPHGQRQNLSPSGSGQHQPKFQPQPETTTDNTSPIKKPRLSEM